MQEKRKKLLQLQKNEMNEIQTSRKGKSFVLFGIGILLLVVAVPAYGGVMAVVDEKRRSKILDVIKRWKLLIIKYADKWGIQRSLVAAIIAQESTGNPQAPHPIIPRLHITVLGWTQGEKWKQHPNYNNPQIFNRAYGLMGLLYPVFLAQYYGIPKCFTANPPISLLEDPNTNIDMGCKLLKTEKLPICKGDIQCAIGKYGEGWLYANSVIGMSNTVIPTDFA